MGACSKQGCCSSNRCGSCKSKSSSGSGSGGGLIKFAGAVSTDGAYDLADEFGTGTIALQFVYPIAGKRTFSNLAVRLAGSSQAQLGAGESVTVALYIDGVLVPDWSVAFTIADTLPAVKTVLKSVVIASGSTFELRATTAGGIEAEAPFFVNATILVK